MKSRSAAIKTALANYNAAAAELNPPRSTLSWEEVVDYAFLADFDLLRDARQDIRQKPWASPAARLTMDSYFKTLRAAEEIQRLNIEIRRLATFVRDEDLFLRSQETLVQQTNPILAHAISLYRLERGRFNAHHLTIIEKIYALPGFTGTTSYGVRQVNGAARQGYDPISAPWPPVDAQIDRPPLLPVYTDDADGDREYDEEQADEDEEVDALSEMCGVLTVAEDGS